ncbi:Uma2 family endonuclease [Streptomyces boninensis]|uniref:Uma2 family endonuclease n=1 Tax=Streptomyces boninensis TaxID=2039455 RepID=UPI003B211B28
MTVVDCDRIETADNGEAHTLDEMFGWLERMPVPEGFKAEIVGGNIYMAPQRDVHWQIIRRIVRALEDQFGPQVNVTSDVRIDFPGHLNGFCPDVAKIRDGAGKDSSGCWHHQDIEFVAEVISKGTAGNDYGPKKAAYAAAEVPAYLIADPYQRKCHLFSVPKNGEYETEIVVTFGAKLDLSPAGSEFTLDTGTFPVR